MELMRRFLDRLGLFSRDELDLPPPRQPGRRHQTWLPSRRRSGSSPVFVVRSVADQQMDEAHAKLRERLR